MKIYNELESLGFFEWLSETHDLADTDMKAEYLDKLPLNDIHRTVCNSMSFRWFREKYVLYPFIQPTTNNDFSCIVFTSNAQYHFGIFETYLEAELACLKKLIEIVKHK